MSVLIKGMKMPKNCETCEYQTKGACFASGVNKGTITIRRMDKDRPDWCPLVDIKTPHGDLMDRDEFLKRMNVAIAMISGTMKVMGVEDDEEMQVVLETYRDIRDGVKDCDTAIEAEGEG